jgi:hypothetical protein
MTKPLAIVSSRNDIGYPYPGESGYTTNGTPNAQEVDCKNVRVELASGHASRTTLNTNLADHPD